MLVTLEFEPGAKTWVALLTGIGASLLLIELLLVP